VLVMDSAKTRGAPARRDILITRLLMMQRAAGVVTGRRLRDPRSLAHLRCPAYTRPASSPTNLTCMEAD